MKARLNSKRSRRHRDRHEQDHRDDFQPAVIGDHSEPSDDVLTVLERLREDEQDDCYLLLGEKLARAFAMPPLAAGPLLAMLFRTHLPTRCSSYPHR